MTRSALSTALAFGITTLGCSDTQFTERTALKTPSQKSVSEAEQVVEPAIRGSGATIAVEETPEPESTFRLGATTSQRKGEQDAPVELLFVLDNSRSMEDNILSLKESVSGLFNSLKTEGIKYNARILTLDKFLEQLVETDNPAGMAPVGMFDGEKPNYTRGVSADDQYLSVLNFSQDFPVADIEQAIAQSVESGGLIQNEPGICTALDYVNWASMSTADGASKARFAEEQALHVILLSDEDNATKIGVKIDPFTGIPAEEKGLYCYQSTETSAAACEKFDIRLDWTGFGYRWREPSKRQYRYSYTYATPSLCQKREAVPFPDGVDDIVKLRADSQCRRDRKICEDTQRVVPVKYQCESPPHPNFLHTKNQSGNYQCDEAQRFDCQTYDKLQRVTVTKNRVDALKIINSTTRYHRCNAADVNVISTKPQDYIGKRRCVAAKNFSCDVIDGAGTVSKQILARDAAEKIIQSSDKTVYACQAGGYKSVFNSNVATTTRRCHELQEFECQQWVGDSKEYVKRSRVDALKIIKDGGPSRHECSALSVKDAVFSDNLALTTGRCQVQTNLECERFVDGSKVFVPVGRELAEATLKSGAGLTCRTVVGEQPVFAEQDRTVDDPVFKNPSTYFASCSAYTCKDISDLSCRVPATPIFASKDYAITDLAGLDLPKFGIQQCESYSCQAITGQSCTAIPDAEPIYDTFEANDSRMTNPAYGISQCMAFDCTDEGPLTCKVADAPLYSLKTYAKSDAKLKEKDKFGLSNCQEISCEVSETRLQEVTLDDIQIAAGGDRFKNCRVTTPEFKAKFTLNPVGLEGRFEGVSTKACSSHGPAFKDAPSSALLSDAQFCLSRVKAVSPNLPEGVTSIAHEAKSVASKTSATTDYYVTKRAQAQVASDLKIDVGHFTAFKEEEKVTVGATVEEYYTFEKYPIDSPTRAEKEDFVAIQDSPHAGPQSVLMGSDENNAMYPRHGGATSVLTRESPLWAAYVKETRLPTGEGRYEECAEPQVTQTRFGGTAEEFLQIVRGLYPKRSFTWHSIVNLDGKSCPDQQETNIAAGKEYLKLSAATKGVVASICDTKNDKMKTFISSVASQVINELDLVYSLPEGVTGAAVTAVINVTRDQPLVLDIDYRLVDDSIVFEKGVFEDGDQLEIRHR